MVASADVASSDARGRRASALSPEARREHIVDASLPLFMERGSAVTIREIACACGIAEGTIFRAFPDKEALVDAVVARALDPGPVEARLAEIDLAQPLADRLVAAVRILQERVISIWQLLTAVGVARRPGADDQQEQRRLSDLRALAALFEPDRDELALEPVACARALRAVAIAGGHPALMGEDLLTPDDIVGLFLDGARVHTCAPRHSPI